MPKGTLFKYIFTAVGCTLLLSISLSANAASVLYSSQSEKLKTLAVEIASALNARSDKHWQALASDNISQASEPFLTLGTAATKAALKAYPKQTLHTTLLTRSQQHALEKNALPAPPAWHTLAIDPPAEQMLQLAHSLLPNAKQIGILFSPDSAEQIEHYKQALTNGQVLHTELVEAETEPARALKTLLPKIDVLIALADSNIYNANSAYAILLSTYRASIPVLATSRGFTRAGALASLHADREDLASHVAEWVLSHAKNEKKVQIHSLSDFKLSINRQVERTLGLLLSDVPGYKDAVQ